MYTYYWYLVHKKDLPQFSSLKENWLLVCPDFPTLYITDVGLDTRTYRDNKYMKLAQSIVEETIQLMYSNGDTIPSGQQRVPQFFCFEITVTNREPSSPSH